MDRLLTLLLIALSRLWLALVGLVAVTFPGLLIAMPLWLRVDNEVLALLIGLAGLGTSLVFWRGVRAFESGRMLTDAALRYGLYNSTDWRDK